MVSLSMVVLDILVNEPSEVALPQRDHSIEALVLDRPDKPLGIRIVKSRQLQLMPTLRIELFASRIPSIL